MHFERLTITGPIKIIPDRFEDRRGYVSEVFNAGWFRAHIRDGDFAQPRLADLPAAFSFVCSTEEE